MIKYVIFDMDGTLIDTEPLYEQSWRETGNKYGVYDAGDMYADFVCGRSLENARLALKDRYGKDFDTDGFIDTRMNRYRELIKSELKVKAGCRDILEFLKKHSISCAVATSTFTDLAIENLERVDILKYFSAIVTSSMVEHGKPAPDIFIEAGKRICAVTDQSIVCEDSYSGISAAYNAGMKPVFIPDRHLPNEETNRLAYATLNSLFDVIDLIKKENNIQ